MGTESDGFPDEPTFNLAALAGQEQLQERIRDLENERAGKVLVDPEDLRAILARGEFAHLTVENAREIGRRRREAETRLIDAAGSAPSGHPTSPERAQGVLPGMTPRPAASEASQGDSARSGDDGP